MRRSGRRCAKQSKSFPATGLKEDVWQQFAKTLYYVRGGYEDARRLSELERVRRQGSTAQPGLPARVFYLATPPDAYEKSIECIAGAGLAQGDARRAGRPRRRSRNRSDATCKRRANSTAALHKFSDERQIYRIDHYLGKETVQNIMVFRFANAIFEPIWNRRYVDHVQITVAETVGVESRGGYYEEAGVMRDMLQNHLLQLLCLTAMEPPVGLDADAVRDEKGKLLKSIRPIARRKSRRRRCAASTAPAGSTARK